MLPFRSDGYASSLVLGYLWDLNWNNWDNPWDSLQGLDSDRTHDMSQRVGVDLDRPQRCALGHGIILTYDYISGRQRISSTSLFTTALVL